MDDARKAAFLSRYDSNTIWTGSSFIGFHDLRGLLAELPVCAGATPLKQYRSTIAGGLELVFGELLFNLLSFEGYFRDKAYHVKECAVKPVVKNGDVTLEFALAYQTKKGEPGTQTFEVVRSGERNYLFFTDPYRPV